VTRASTLAAVLPVVKLEMLVSVVPTAFVATWCRQESCLITCRRSDWAKLIRLRTTILLPDARSIGAWRWWSREM
jgi:hypothetical protein